MLASALRFPQLSPAEQNLTSSNLQFSNLHVISLQASLTMTLLRMTTRLPRQLVPQLRQTQPIRPTLLSSLPAPAPAQAPHLRSFTTSRTLYKKKDKAGKKGAAAEPPSKSNASASTSDGPDPFDLSTLETGISTSLSKLKDDLSKLRAGGRFNTSTLENLKVHLGKGKDAEIVKLCDLAQVVPKGGRMVSILAAEEDVSPPLPPNTTLHPY